MNGELFRPQVTRARVHQRFSRTVLPTALTSYSLALPAVLTIVLGLFVINAPWHASYQPLGQGQLSHNCVRADGTSHCRVTLRVRSTAAALPRDSVLRITAPVRGESGANCVITGAIVGPHERYVGRATAAHGAHGLSAWEVHVRLVQSNTPRCPRNGRVGISLLRRRPLRVQVE